MILSHSMLPIQTSLLSSISADIAKRPSMCQSCTTTSNLRQSIAGGRLSYISFHLGKTDAMDLWRAAVTGLMSPSASS